MRALFFSFLAAVILSAQLHAAEIRGRVLDPSGAAVSGARVSAIEQSSNLQSSMLTGGDGSYVIQGLNSGEWLIDAQFPGFGASAAARVRVDDGAATVVDLKLQLQRVSNQVQVTAAGAPQTIDEQAKALTIIDAQQVSDREEFSVAEAIRNVPGIRVQQLGGPGSLVRVITRGMRPQDTSLLIDGFRMRDAGAPQGDATAFLGDLLLVDADRIEVLRGSGSSLYGTHATGGVINVITAGGDAGTHGELAVEGGGLGLFRGLAKVGGSAFRDAKLRYSIGATHLNLTSGIDGDDRLRNSMLHGSLQYRFGSATEVSGRVIANNGFSQLNDTPYAIDPVPPGDIVKAIPYVTFVPGPERSGYTEEQRLFLRSAFCCRITGLRSPPAASAIRESRRVVTIAMVLAARGLSLNTRPPIVSMDGWTRCRRERICTFSTAGSPPDMNGSVRYSIIVRTTSMPRRSSGTMPGCRSINRATPDSYRSSSNSWTGDCRSRCPDESRRFSSRNLSSVTTQASTGE